MRREFAQRVLVTSAILSGIFAAYVPGITHGQVANFVFGTDPQIVAPGAVSEQITVQARGSGGESAPLPQTGCLSLSSASTQGEFSSNASNWSTVSVLTMNKSTANRSFYYKDTLEGTHTLTVKIALKPEGESRSCASWPVEEWNTEWTVTQNITIGQGSANASNNTQNSQVSAQTSSQTSAQSSAAGSSASTAEFSVDGGSDRVVVVDADAQFSARAYNRDKKIVESAGFTWNFGDGSTGQGTSVTHRFEYAGRYAVVVTGFYEGSSGSDRFTVTAEAAQLAVRAVSDGSVEIENLGIRDVDLSRWIIQSAGGRFALPENSLVLAGHTMRISPNTMHFYAGSVTELTYPDGTRAFRAGEVMEEAAPARPSPISVQTSDEVVHSLPNATEKEQSAQDADTLEEAREEREEGKNTVGNAATSSQVAAVGAVSGSWKWWMAALALVFLGAGSIYVAQRYAKREWSIVEDTTE